MPSLLPAFGSPAVLNGIFVQAERGPPHFGAKTLVIYSWRHVCILRDLEHPTSCRTMVVLQDRWPQPPHRR